MVETRPVAQVPSDTAPEHVRAALTEAVRRGARRIATVRVTVEPGLVETEVRRMLASPAPTEPIQLHECIWPPTDPTLGNTEAIRLAGFGPDVLIVCTDACKDQVLLGLNKLDWPKGRWPSVITFGIAHQELLLSQIADIEAGTPPLEISHATGYRYAKAHLFDVLRSLQGTYRSGLVVELGVFRGGTLLLLKRFLKVLNFNGPQLLGFDTFDGFPKRCLLDLFSMDEFINRDYEGTQLRMASEGIRVIRGDIVDTAQTHLTGKQILLTFCDTDNYSPIAAALPVCWEGTVRGGAVVFDHYYTREGFGNTIGERIAAWEFFRGRTDYLHLSGTGVFVKR